MAEAQERYLSKQLKLTNYSSGKMYTSESFRRASSDKMD